MGERASINVRNSAHLHLYTHVFLFNYINNSSFLSHFRIFLVCVCVCVCVCVGRGLWLFHKFTFIQECELLSASMHSDATYVFTGSTFQTRYKIERTGLESIIWIVRVSRLCNTVFRAGGRHNQLETQSMTPLKISWRHRHTNTQTRSRPNWKTF